MFKLKFPSKDITRWASKYDYPESDDVPAQLGEIARSSGVLTREQFLAMAQWKTRRSKSRCAKNSEEFVAEVTSTALRSTVPRFKIEVLRLLDGVDWPTASVILHFCDSERWPIIDFRAFWSLGAESGEGRYDFDTWQEYTTFTRKLADSAKVDMRTLDRALWAFSKANQKVVPA